MLEVMRWFRAISSIPRESGNEKEISNFLVNWAKERNLEVHQDSSFNVIIKKEATEKYKNAPTVIIQGHTDMVCVKTKDSNHNFNTDPIEIIEDNDIVRANNTTLGADNGIAIAYGLALLDSNNIEHPKIELLCTSSEETDMSGALSLKSENLSGKIILNIDGEEEDVFIVSSAGGITPIIRFNIKKENINDNGSNLKISISGLKGGHSGMEINKQRANAIKILARILYSIREYISIISIDGGSKDNAIATYSECIIHTNNKEDVENIINKLYKNIKNEYSFEDSDIKINIEEVHNIKETFSKELSNDIIDFLMAIPYGVEYMYNNDELKGLVKSSLNIGVIREFNNKIEVIVSIRSAEESLLEEINNKIKIIAKRTNAEVEDTAPYPSWKFEKNSKIIEIIKETYKDFSGREPIITSIHAGLECGILKQLIPDADIVSFGPDIFNVHTTEEYFNKASVERTWQYLKKLLSHIK